MAQFATDFSEQTVGQPPTGWTPRWVTTDITYQIVDLGGGQKGLRITPSADERHGISYDPAGTSTVTEVLMRVRINDSALPSAIIRAVTRGAGVAGDEYALMASIDTDGDYQVSYYAGTGNSGSIPKGTPSLNDPTLEDTWYWLLFRADSTHVRAAKDTSVIAEPPTWDIEKAHEDVVADAGWAGIVTFYQTSFDVSFFSVGTNGDPAPRSIIEGNQSPYVASHIADVTGVPGDPDVTIDLRTVFADPDEDELTFTVQSGTTASIDLDGYTLRVDRSSAVSETVTVRATDPSSAYVEDSFTVNVNVEAPIVASKAFELGSYASVDVSGSTITITPRQTFLEEGKDYGDRWWYAAKLTGVQGAQPTIVIPFGTHFQPPSASCRYACWSSDYDPATGLGTWHDFDNNGVSSQTATVSNNAAFAENEIYVAHYPIYPMVRVDAKVAEWLADSRVTPAPSADVAGVFAVATARTDDVAGANGIALGGENFYGLRIKHPNVWDAKQIVVTAGNHCGETPAMFTMEGLVEWLLGGSTAANDVLQSFEVIVYPCVDPQGNRAGYYRSTPENPAQNHNRNWTDTTPVLESHAFVRAALSDDLDASRCVAVFDLHCYGNAGSTGGNHFLYDFGSPYDQNPAFHTAIKVYDPSVQKKGSPSGDTLRMLLESLAPSPIQVAITTETSPLLSRFIPEYRAFGENVVRATYDVFADGTFGPMVAPAITLTPASQTALNLSLSEVDGATGYRYRVGTSGSWTDLGSGRTAQITGLSPGTSYTVQARAYNSAGDGPIGSATASTLEPEVNAPPVFQTSPPTTVRAGEAYVYHGVVTDADGDPITITLEEGPDWLELTDHGDGTFTLEGTAPNE